MRWPDGFIWGTGASSTQCEGGRAGIGLVEDWGRARRAPRSDDGNGFAGVMTRTSPCWPSWAWSTTGYRWSGPGSSPSPGSTIRPPVAGEAIKLANAEAAVPSAKLDDYQRLAARGRLELSSNDPRCGRVAEHTTRSVSAGLTPGPHAFRYLADGGRWLDEPDAPAEPDDYGSTRSVLVIS